MIEIFPWLQFDIFVKLFEENMPVYETGDRPKTRRGHSMKEDLKAMIDKQ